MRRWFITTLWVWLRDQAYYLVTAFAVVKLTVGYFAHQAGIWIDPAIRHGLVGLPQFRVSAVVIIFQLLLLAAGLTKLYRSNIPKRWSVPAIAGWLGLVGGSPIVWLAANSGSNAFFSWCCLSLAQSLTGLTDILLARLFL